jgi:hypothetical protein
MVATLYPDSTRQAQVSAGTTVSGEWRPRANPSAGMGELNWFRANRPHLRNYTNLWIAIARNRVVASSNSVDDVFRQLDALAVVDPLIVYVKPFPRTSRRIA